MERNRLITVDGQTLRDLEALHDSFAPLFPAGYGRNLDALYDCLTDLGEDVTVTLRRPQALAERFGPRGRALAALLRRAAEENPHVRLLEKPEEGGT